MRCCPKLRPCTQRLNLLMILSTIDLDSSFTFYAEENCEIAPVCRSFSWISAFLFIPNPVSERLPVNLISCQMFLQLFLLSNTYFSSFLLPWPIFLKRAAAIKFNMSSYFFFNETKCLSLDISCFLCSTVNNIWIWDCHIIALFSLNKQTQGPKIFGIEVVETLFTTTSMPTMCPSFILSDLQVCADTNTSCVWPWWRRATSLCYNFHVLWCKFQNCEGLCPQGCLIVSPLQTPGEPTASIHSCYISELCP